VRLRLLQVRSSVVVLGMLIRADMCDGMGMLHQGCMAFLMDEYGTPLCHYKIMNAEINLI